MTSRRDSVLSPSADASRQVGIAAGQRGDWAAAEVAFERAARQSPGVALLWINLARARMRQGKGDAAIAAAEHATHIAPDDPLACAVLAEYLLQLKRPLDALAAFDRYPEHAPRDYEWHNSRGNAYYLAEQPQRAVPCLMSALQLKIDAPLAHYRLGLALKDLGLTADATACFRTAVLLGDDGVSASARSMLVFDGRQMCEWDDIEADTAALLDAVDRSDDEVVMSLLPFAFVSIPASPAQLLRVASLHTRLMSQGLPLMPPQTTPRRPGKIRLAYLSADFFNHATAALMVSVLEQRDRSRFEVYLYSHRDDDGSAMSQRVRSACEHLIDCKTWSDQRIAQHMRDAGIDIAIDLKGHTRDTRFHLLAQRPAPVQASFLGYPGTSGAPFIDYIVGDPIVTPMPHAPHFSECIAQLPTCYQPNDSQRPLPPPPSRLELGLPEHAVVLACLNQTYKLSPQMLDHWAAILAGAPQAVLWLLAWNTAAQQRLAHELSARGVPDERVFWTDQRSLPDHLARLQQANLFLDTWPCGAHTTASEALWCGVPVLTCPGETFASRVGASLVTACGLADCVATSPQDYVQRGIALANDRPRLTAMQEHLRQRRLSLPLFDSARFAREWEALLTLMHERHLSGLPPSPIPASEVTAKLDATTSLAAVDEAANC